MAIDLTTTAQTFVSNSAIPDASNILDVPGKIALDNENNQAYVMDNELGLIAIDLKTGRRVVMSR